MENENKEQRFLVVDSKLERMPPIPQLTRLDLFKKIAELKAQITKLEAENKNMEGFIQRLQTPLTRTWAQIRANLMRNIADLAKTTDVSELKKNLDDCFSFVNKSPQASLEAENTQLRAGIKVMKTLF